MHAQIQVPALLRTLLHKVGKRQVLALLPAMRPCFLDLKLNLACSSSSMCEMPSYLPRLELLHRGVQSETSFSSRSTRSPGRASCSPRLRPAGTHRTPRRPTSRSIFSSHSHRTAGTPTFSSGACASRGRATLPSRRRPAAGTHGSGHRAHSAGTCSAPGSPPPPFRL